MDADSWLWVALIAFPGLLLPADGDHGAPGKRSSDRKRGEDIGEPRKDDKAAVTMLGHHPGIDFT